MGGQGAGPAGQHRRQQPAVAGEGRGGGPVHAAVHGNQLAGDDAAVDHAGGEPEVEELVPAGHVVVLPEPPVEAHGGTGGGLPTATVVSGTSEGQQRASERHGGDHAQGV
jgi:hypothetical protein